MTILRVPVYFMNLWDMMNAFNVYVNSKVSGTAMHCTSCAGG